MWVLSPNVSHGRPRMKPSAALPNRQSVPKLCVMSDIGGIGGIGGTGGYAPTADGPVSCATALTILRKNKNATVEINDTAQNILRNLDNLRPFVSRIDTLATTDSNQNLVVTQAQYQKETTILAKWGEGSGQTISITAAKASISVSLPNYVSSVSVSDTVAAIQRNLDNLESMAESGLLQEIVQTGAAAPLSLTVDQLTSDETALGLIKNRGYSLAITGATVSDVLGLGSDPAIADNVRVKSIAIVDSTDNIANNLDALQRIGLRIRSIAQTDAATPLEITGAQYKLDSLVLGKITTSDMLAVMDASASQARALTADARVVTATVQDTAGNISRNWALLQRLTDLTAIEVSDDTNPIRLTADQVAGSQDLLGKFSGTYSLVVTNVSASAALATSALSNVQSVEISDTGANLVANMDDLQTLDAAGGLQTIVLANPTVPITIDVSRLQGDQLAATQGVLGKIKGGSYKLAVEGAATSDLADLASNSHVASISVRDESSNIAASLNTLYTLGSRVKTIQQTDSGTALALTQTQLDTRATVLAKIQGGYRVDLTNASASKALSDARNLHVGNITVSDTASHIAANWAKLSSLGNALVAVNVTDGAPVILSADNYQLGVHDQLVDKLDGGVTYKVTSASIAQALAIAGDDVVSQIDMVAEGAAIVDNLDDLATLASGGKLHAIINQTPTTNLAVTASQLSSAQPVLDLIKGGSYSLAISGVAVEDAKDLLASNHKIASMNVSGDGATIVANLSDLSGLGRKLATITQSDGDSSPLALTATEYERNSVALGKLVGGFQAILSDVTAAKAATFARDTSVTSLSISDSGDNLGSAWGSLADIGLKLAGVTQTDASDLQITANDWIRGQALRAMFASDPTVSLLSVGVSQIASLASDDAVVGMQVKDTADILSASLADLAAETKVTQLVVDDPTVALTMSGEDYATYADLLSVVKDGQYELALGDVLASDVGSLVSDTHVVSLDVSDSSDAISANFDDLAAADALNTITLTDEDGTVTLTGAQILASSATLDRIAGSYQLAATEVALDDLASITDLVPVASVSISDTADTVSSGFSDILDLGTTLATLHLTDATPVLTLTAQDWTAGQDALGTIDVSYEVDLSEALAGDATTLAAEGTVRELSVADTASNIAGNWDALVALYDEGSGKLKGLSLNDGNSLTLTEAQQTAGATLIADLLADETILTA
jgi:hypothetical protein